MIHKMSRLPVALMSIAIVQLPTYAWIPRVTALGEMGSYETAWVDGLFPVQDSTNQVSFLDLQYQGNHFLSSGSYSGLVSPGIGLRHVFQDDKVVGAYIFSDYMTTNAHQYYWLLGPGVDYYHERWFASINAYIPVNNGRRFVSSIPVSDTGDTRYESFAGHAQYDRLFSVYDSMRWGLDATTGVLLGPDNKWGIKGGPYVYAGHHLETITGGRGELDYFVRDNLVLRIEERYDSYFGNQALLGISVSFGSTENRGTVKTQLKAPIFRNLNINTTAQGTPIGRYQQMSSQSMLINNNITFVSNQNNLNGFQTSSPALQEGTFEHPYTTIDQAFVPGNSPTDAKIWVEKTGSAYTSQGFTMLGTQSLSGRTSGFYEPAVTMTTQPLVLSSVMNGAAVTMHNSNSMQNIIIEGTNGPGTIGVSVMGDNTHNTASLNNVTIGSQNTDNAFETGLYNSAANVLIKNSTVYAAARDNGVLAVNATAFGIVNDDNNPNSMANTTLDNTHVTVNALVTGGNTAKAYGILNEGNANTATITLQNGTTVTVNAQGDTLAYTGAYAYGVYNLGGTILQPPSNPDSTATTHIQSGSIIRVTAGNTANNTNNSGSNAYGVYTTQNIDANGPTIYGGIVNVTIDQSTVNATQYGLDSINPGSGIAAGVFQGAQANYQKTPNTVTIKNHSAISAESNGSQVGVIGLGAYNYSGSDTVNNSNLTVSDSTVTTTAGAYAGTSYGVYLTSAKGTFSHAVINVVHHNVDNSATGVSVHGGQVTINNDSVINVTGYNPMFTGNAYLGLANQNIAGVAESTVTIGAATFNVQSIGGAGGFAYGVVNNGTTSTVSIGQGAVMNVSTTNSGNAYAVDNGDTNFGAAGGTININPSVFNIISTGSGTSYGLWDAATGGVINTSGSLGALPTVHLFYDAISGNAAAYNVSDTTGYNPYPPTQNVTFTCNSGACP